MSKISMNQILEQIKICIYDALEGKPRTKNDYLKAYDLIYTYCSAKTKIDCNIAKSRDHNQINMYGKKLYDKLHSIITEHFCSVSKKITSQMTNLLECYLEHWTLAIKAAEVVDCMCAHMNRHWIKREQIESTNPVCSIYQLIMILWTQIVYFPLKCQLFGEIFREINCDRNSLQSRMGAVKVFCNHLSHLCLSITPAISVDNIPEKSQVFEIHFEPEFLNMTREYYLIYSAEAFQKNPPLQYVAIAKMAFQTEEHRVENYIHSDLIKKVRDTLEDVFIHPRLDVLYLEFDRLIGLQAYDDLKEIYHVLRNQESVLTELKNIFNVHIRKFSIETFLKLGDPRTMDPLIFVKECVEILAKYHHLVVVSFDDSKHFHEAKGSALTYSLNNCYNKSSTLSHPTSKLLAKCADIYLSKQPVPLSTPEIVSRLQKIREIFSFLDDKESFKIYYAEFSAQRFIRNLVASLEAENSFIIMLKNAVDSDYVIDLQKMLLDMENRKEALKDFHPTTPNIITPTAQFSILILTSTAWPLVYLSDANLPTEIKNIVDQYQEFYLSRNKGRKLQWILDASCVEMDLSVKNKKYTLEVSMLQASILNLFNTKSSYKVSELADLTKISIENLSKAILSLINSDILLTSCQSPLKLIFEESTDIIFNENFDCLQQNISLNLPPTYISLANSEDVKYNQMDRDPAVQAAIVRILKKHKQLDIKTIIDFVNNEFASRFNVSFVSIEKNIKSLLERDFLMVSPEDSNVYKYCS